MRCVSQQFTVGKMWVERNIIDENPAYQRESGRWTDEKQQLFIDSVFNSIDVPKVYFHLLARDNKGKRYAVIDGKQRLNALWRFMTGNLRLADDFKASNEEGWPEPPSGAVGYDELSEDWRDIFKSRTIDVVVVEEADEDDIEELFSRLNNGEPLTAAEKRNALGGDMTELIREVAKHSFFSSRLRVSNKGYQHFEIAAKLLLLEKSELDGGAPICDLKKKFLDGLVTNNRNLTAAYRKGLAGNVQNTLKDVTAVFHASDPLLSKAAYGPLYYVWIKLMMRDYAHQQLRGKLRSFLEGFHVRRQQNLQLAEDERDPVLVEFGRLVQQGTNDLGSLEERLAILKRYFLEEHPDVEVRDKQRTFNDAERHAIWVLGGKKCAECNRQLVEISDMHADHERQWSHGGDTSLANGRALCSTCNTKLAKSVA